MSAQDVVLRRRLEEHLADSVLRFRRDVFEIHDVNILARISHGKLHNDQASENVKERTLIF